MDWLHDYEEELRKVFEESSVIISGFPESLRSQGLAYLDQFNVFSTGSHKNYICYLLPFWLRSEFGIHPALTRQMSLGNVLIMLYFFIQDDLMDNKESSAADKLPLANLLYIEFLNIYRPLFPPDSLFWSYFKRYIFEWADSVAREAEADNFMNDIIRIAHKASPLKLCSTAVLLLSGHDHLIRDSEDMLHEVLITLQMVDDYEDWEEDLGEGSYNCLLSLAGHQIKVSPGSLTSGQIRDFVFTSGGLAPYVEIAQGNHRRLADYPLKAPHLLAFHYVLLQNLQHIAAAIEAEKQLLQKGGLHYWLSRFTNT